MSKLEQLINELCPNGVEWIELGNILEYEQPTKYIVESTDYDQSYNIPVLTAGQTFILGYTNERTGIYTASSANPTIIFDDFTTAFHWVDFGFKVKSSAMKMLRPKVTFKGLFRYIYYAMKCIGYEAVDHSRHWISKYSHFEIPIPPLPVQEEIVRILDAFTDYTAELQAELQARREQYEYYRNELLSFEGDSSVEWKLMGDVCDIRRGIRVVKNDLFASGEIPVFQNSLTPLGYHSKSNVPANTTFIIGAGAAGDIGYSNIPYWGADDCFSIICNKDIVNKYIYYFLTNTQRTIKSKVRKASIPRISRGVIERLLIPIPSLSEQKRIVAILDKFEALVNDLTEGLPAEIAARQEQYEYYRDKLLSFPKAV